MAVDVQGIIAPALVGVGAIVFSDIIVRIMDALAKANRAKALEITEGQAGDVAQVSRAEQELCLPAAEAQAEWMYDNQTDAFKLKSTSSIAGWKDNWTAHDLTVCKQYI